MQLSRSKTLKKAAANVLNFHAEKLNEGCKYSEIIEQKHVLASILLLIFFRVALGKHA